MSSRLLTLCLVLPALALGACGSSGKTVNTATYTCAQFNKSLATKADNTSGNFINQLRKQAKLGEPTKSEQRQITLGIYLTCRGKPGATRPAKGAILLAKAARAGQLKLTSPAGATKKKSTK